MSDRRSGGSGGGRSRRVEDNGYADDVYDMYGQQPATNNRRPARETYISEEDEYVVSDDAYANSYDEADFEMMPSNARRDSARRSGPSLKKIRVKVHADDTRYVMVGTAVEFRDFIDQIRAKFGIRQSFKVKIRDEQDMITMADQDDLDMAIESARASAKREKSDMGKMEVSFPPAGKFYSSSSANVLCVGLDTGCLRLQANRFSHSHHFMSTLIYKGQAEGLEFW